MVSLSLACDKDSALTTTEHGVTELMTTVNMHLMHQHSAGLPVMFAEAVAAM